MANESWKAALIDESSFADIIAAAGKINSAGLATHFKLLKKDLSLQKSLSKSASKSAHVCVCVI